MTHDFKISSADASVSTANQNSLGFSSALTDRKLAASSRKDAVEKYLLQYSKNPLPRAGKDIKWPFSDTKRILIDNSQRVLVLINGNGTARIYDCAVGAVFKDKNGKTVSNQWTGNHKIISKQRNPKWSPTENQMKKNPKLKPIAGGTKNNPKGVAQLEVNIPAIRIHGINETKAKLNSIGTASSDGCIRMFNEGIKDLYARVGKIDERHRFTVVAVA